MENPLKHLREQIKPDLHRPDKEAVPEYCLNESCIHHHPGPQNTGNWYKHFGSHKTKAHGIVPRFRCKACKKTFSTQSFSIHYWTHRVMNMEQFESVLVGSSGQRQLGRSLKASGRLVKNRCQRLARNYLACYAEVAKHHTITEDCAFDGFESFVRSQYFPASFNILIGSESLALYGVSVNLMRRKGRMTAIQKANRTMIDEHFKPKPSDTKKACMIVFESLKGRIRESDTPWELWTDKHKAYPTALHQIDWTREAIENESIVHNTISSKAARIRSNPLFPVNYMDREARKDMADHARETVRFPREINMAIQRMIAVLGAHTFGKPKTITGRCFTDQDPTHADEAGMTQIDSVQYVVKNRHTKRFLYSHASKGGCPDWITMIWKELYKNPPVVDFVTGEEIKKRQYGKDRKSAHLFA